MRIAGIYPQPIELDLGLDPDPDEPLGIGYVLACAANRGHDVQLFVPVHGNWHETDRYLMAFRPHVVAVSALTKHVDVARNLARRLRHRVNLLVAGGSHPTAAPFDLLSDFDVCVIGEGEETFVELLSAVASGNDLASVRGITYLASDGAPRQTPSRPRIANLDALPWPVREPRLHRTEALGISYPLSRTAGFASSLYGRGCPFTCSFCSSPQHWGCKVAFRSADDVLAEFADLRDRFGVTFVSFADLTFTINRRRTVELCEKLVTANLGVHWMCETSVNTIDAELLRLMAAAGCTKICWGIETADDASVRAIGKRQSRDQAREVLEWAQNEGIFNWAFTMIGFPWQSQQDILSASAQLEDLPIHQLRVSIATPFPGTEWASSFPASLGVPWSHWDTNHLVYRHPTTSAREMKALQKAVLRRFYASAAYGRRMAAMAWRFAHLRESIEAFETQVDRWLRSTRGYSAPRRSLGGGSTPGLRLNLAGSCAPDTKAGERPTSRLSFDRSRAR